MLHQSIRPKHSHTTGLGYIGAAAIFSAILFAVAILHFYSKVSKALLFWSAFILTRPLGALVGGFLDKPIASGGLELSRYIATCALFMAIIILIVVLPQRAVEKVH